MMFHPKSNLKRPATIFPSENLVATPKIRAVIGIIARIMLRTLPNLYDNDFYAF